MTADDSRGAPERGAREFAPQWGCGYATGQRESNQDSFAVDPRLGLWLVADGMGGHRSGEVAAAVTAHTVVSEVRRRTPLQAAVQRAHRELRGLRGGGRHASMGSTVVAALFDGPRFEIAWVGDSRAYLWDGALAALSRDHSVVQELLDAGAISEEDARTHPARTVITQALGASDARSVAVGSTHGRLPPGGRLLLCSDGLHGEVADADIAAVLEDVAGAQEAADRLVGLALERGGSDNVTVLVIDRNAHAAAGEAELIDLGDTASLDVFDELEADRSRRHSLVYGLVAGLCLVLAAVVAKLAGA